MYHQQNPICSNSQLCTSPYTEQPPIAAPLASWTLADIILVTLGIAGGLLRIWCFRTLDHFFTFQITIHEKHRLIKEGPYAYVRHPSYSGLIMIQAAETYLIWRIVKSWPLWIQHARWIRLVWLYTLVEVVIILVVTTLRIEIEEKALKERFGKEWNEYKEKRKIYLLAIEICKVKKNGNRFKHEAETLTYVLLDFYNFWIPSDKSNSYFALQPTNSSPRKLWSPTVIDFQNRGKTQGKSDSKRQIEYTINCKLLVKLFFKPAFEPVVGVNIAAFISKIPISPQFIKDKLKLRTDVWAGKNANEHEDENFRKAAIWGEFKFVRTVVCLGMLLQVNIIDEALIAREQVIKRNANRQGLSAHSIVRSRKDLQKNFRNPHGISTNILDSDERAVSFTIVKLMSGSLHGYTRCKKQLRETQADGFVHAVSGVRTPFTWYSPTKGLGKLGKHSIGRIVGICSVGHGESQDKKGYIKNRPGNALLAYYCFRQRLINKAEELRARVTIQNEAYTSKTCSQCGNIQRMGGGVRNVQLPELWDCDR
ncbi:hypothetical protein G9A89_008819 [Geosiphon pyriformis]|nr:hypothetical protein G9A89_008819 [Geosiphon pyriformis]